jgi:hypothetical protein
VLGHEVNNPTTYNSNGERATYTSRIENTQPLSADMPFDTRIFSNPIYRSD